MTSANRNDALNSTGHQPGTAKECSDAKQAGWFGQEAERAYDFKVDNLLREYNELTLPSFDLAARQGEREYQALLQNTMNTIDGASTPYQEAIIFDPLEPIAGLKPEKGMVTKVAKPGWGSILTNSFIQGAQGALGMSYTNSSGNPSVPLIYC